MQRSTLAVIAEGKFAQALRPFVQFEHLILSLFLFFACRNDCTCAAAEAAQ